MRKPIEHIESRDRDGIARSYDKHSEGQIKSPARQSIREKDLPKNEQEISDEDMEIVEDSDLDSDFEDGIQENSSGGEEKDDEKQKQNDVQEKFMNSKRKVNKNDTKGSENQKSKQFVSKKVYDEDKDAADGDEDDDDGDDDEYCDEGLDNDSEDEDEDEEAEYEDESDEDNDYRGNRSRRNKTQNRQSSRGREHKAGRGRPRKNAVSSLPASKRSERNKEDIRRHGDSRKSGQNLPPQFPEKQERYTTEQKATLKEQRANRIIPTPVVFEDEDEEDFPVRRAKLKSRNVILDDSDDNSFHAPPSTDTLSSKTICSPDEMSTKRKVLAAGISVSNANATIPQKDAQLDQNRTNTKESDLKKAPENTKTKANVQKTESSTKIEKQIPASKKPDPGLLGEVLTPEVATRGIHAKKVDPADLDDEDESEDEDDDNYAPESKGSSRRTVNRKEQSNSRQGKSDGKTVASANQRKTSPGVKRARDFQSPPVQRGRKKFAPEPKDIHCAITFVPANELPDIYIRLSDKLTQQERDCLRTYDVQTELINMSMETRFADEADPATAILEEMFERIRTEKMYLNILANAGADEMTKVAQAVARYNAFNESPGEVDKRSFMRGKHVWTEEEKKRYAEAFVKYFLKQKSNKRISEYVGNGMYTRSKKHSSKLWLGS
eukprot:TRINITY_DN481_c0_g1_i1.p1 TRINITY_DN481_c0_g1~~TRINITY_DN481_c0_g1_i1.p1  ORF type:complete len:665 (-),score=155.97 TRINITY_DN481_c0_g1_i1:3537-5531(-)